MEPSPARDSNDSTNLLKTLKDSKMLEIQYQEVVNERISFSNRATQLQGLLDLQIEQTRQSQEQLLEAQQKSQRKSRWGAPLP